MPGQEHINSPAQTVIKPMLDRLDGGLPPDTRSTKPLSETTEPTVSLNTSMTQHTHSAPLMKLCKFYTATGKALI